jgi:hypothetical protein
MNQTPVRATARLRGWLQGRIVHIDFEWHKVCECFFLLVWDSGAQLGSGSMACFIRTNEGRLRDASGLSASPRTSATASGNDAGQFAVAEDAETTIASRRSSMLRAPWTPVAETRRTTGAMTTNSSD